MRELVGKGANKRDKGGVLGDESLETPELATALEDGFLHPPRSLPRLLMGEKGSEGGDRSLYAVAHGRQEQIEKDRENCRRVSRRPLGLTTESTPSLLILGQLQVK